MGADEAGTARVLREHRAAVDPLGRGAWLTTADDEKLVFDEDRNEVCDEAMKHRARDL